MLISSAGNRAQNKDKTKANTNFVTSWEQLVITY